MLMHTDRIDFLDLRFDRLTFDEVKVWLRSITPTTPYGYIVTPNVDLTVRSHREHGLRELYGDADLCVCDSRILRLLARFSGISLPLIAGSDLAAAVVTKIARPGDRIAVVGGTQSSLARLRKQFPKLEFVHHEPPMGLLRNAEARSAAASFIASADARFTMLAVGSPQQEMIASEVRGSPTAGGVALCIGAGLDFITGDQKRAPLFLQRLNLEWAHRLASNPRRLWRRYLVEGMRIFPIYWKWLGRGSKWRFAFLIVAAAGLLSAVYIGATHFSGGRSAGGSALTTPLPPAAQLAQIRLPPPDLLKPLSPEEAAKENGERPFVARPDSAAAKFILKTDAQDRARAVNCLAQAVYYEAAGEGLDGGRAVAQVVLNRMRHPGYPASVCGVVYQGAERATGCQFTFTCDGSLLRTPAASLWARSRKIAEEALAGKVFAPVGHATHYHADYVLPYWADSLDKSVQIGRHIFYRLRSSLGDSRAFFQRYAGTEPSPPPPSAAVVIPTAAVTEQLANALISNDVTGPSKDVEKANAPASSPLAIDASKGSLLADAQSPAAPVRKAKPAASDCPASNDRKQLSPMGANDVRASSSTTGC